MKLYELYNKFNDQYFESKLPKKPKLGIIIKEKSRRKNFLGITVGYYDTEKKEITKIELIINKKILNDKKLLEKVLLHEMIHVWELNAKNNLIEEEHSKDFYKKKKELEEKFNLKIL